MTDTPKSNITFSTEEVTKELSSIEKDSDVKLSAIIPGVSDVPLTRSQAHHRQRNVKRSTTASKYRGVSYNKGTKNSWRACIRFGGFSRSLGYYDSEEDAARAYDRAAIAIYRDLARTNFPISDYGKDSKI